MKRFVLVIINMEIFDTKHFPPLLLLKDLWKLIVHEKTAFYLKYAIYLLPIFSGL